MDAVGLGKIGSWLCLVCQRELVGFARMFVETRGWGNEIGDVDRLPDCFFRRGVVDFTRELNGRVPQSTRAPISRFEIRESERRN